jgi:hypothetical protein
MGANIRICSPLICRLEKPICTMIIDARSNQYGRRGTDPSSKLYWLNIELNINDILFRQRVLQHNTLVHPPRPLTLQYCVLHGIGAVANALTVGEKGEDFDHFVVNLASFMQSEENYLEARPSATMTWSEVDPRSQRLEIYISNNMLRHLVELYVTKRIDNVAMFMQIAVIAEPFANIGVSPEILPFLDQTGHLYFRHTQCELLSVFTSLASGRAKARAA